MPDQEITNKTKDIGRRQAIPIIYTRGTHYDVGFDIVRIHSFSSIVVILY